MIKYRDGNMFDYEHDCYVNTINCVGAMGAGIALEFKNRYPDMFHDYQIMCRNYEISVGDCWIHKIGDVYTAHLAVKNHFRKRIRVSWAKIAVRNFINLILNGFLPVKDVALPRIGSKNGGHGSDYLEWSDGWSSDSEKGYVELFEPFLLAELKKCDKVEFTIYKT